MFDGTIVSASSAQPAAPPPPCHQNTAFSLPSGERHSRSVLTIDGPLHDVHAPAIKKLPINFPRVFEYSRITFPNQRGKPAPLSWRLRCHQTAGRIRTSDKRSESSTTDSTR